MLTPRSLADIQALIAEAVRGGEPLEVCGSGSKRGYGRPVAARRTLSTAGIAGVVDYQPRELICVVRPGTPLAELERVLAREGQMLAFEPPHWGEGATIGGTVAANLSGPRRFKAGAARDHLLGFQAVTGRGDAVRGGGRVVKNVTGYDLSKLMCGSFGTLGVLTELCLKVLPRPEAQVTLAVETASEDDALALLRRMARSPHEPSALACLPPGTARPAALAARADPAACLALIRLEGPERSVTLRVDAVAALAGGGAARLAGADSESVWRGMGEVAPLPLAKGERLWRLSVPPDQAGAAAQALRGSGAGPAAGAVRLCYDWGGGLVWAALPGSRDAAVHAAARAAGGHARVARGDPDLAPAEPAFGPLDAVQRQVHQNLKRAFDPQGILNPGRMYAGL